jgi:hypothetical protein
VQVVRVGIADVNNDAGDSWPFSDRVYIISRASVAEVREGGQRSHRMTLSKWEATKPLLRNYRMFDPATRSTWSGGIENPKMPVVVETRRYRTQLEPCPRSRAPISVRSTHVPRTAPSSVSSR